MSKNSQDKVLNALSGLIPEDAREKVSSAISEFLNESVAELEAAKQSEYDEKLKDAYATVTKEKEDAEKVAEQGYAEAYEIICDLRERLEIQAKEYEEHMEEEYQEAYTLLQAERKKNDTLEVGLYEEYDNRLGEMKDYVVDKVDQFLATKGGEFESIIRREVSSDPTVAEEKVALGKFLEVAAHYLTDEEFAFANNKQKEELERLLDEQKGQIKMLEARNMRLNTENTKLNEVARQAQEVLTESTKVERNARKEMAKNAQSKGDKIVEDVKVIGEHNNPEPVTKTDDQSAAENPLLQEWRKLSGVNK